MVLEAAISPLSAERHPKVMFYLGFAFSTIGMIFATFVFGYIASHATIFLTTLPLVVILYNVIKREEEKDKIVYEKADLLRQHGRMINENRFLLKEHSKVISSLIYLFLGITVSYALWYTILPEYVLTNVFILQIVSIQDTTNYGILLTGSLAFKQSLLPLFLTNLRVLIFCIVFSFIYGSGAVFILIWNASILGITIGNIFRRILMNTAGSLKNVYLMEYLGVYTISMGYMIHGIPEVIAYLLGVLGGGIISMAVINHDAKSREFKKILMDSLDMIGLSLVVLLIAAVLEVYISPVFI